jgi:hypothetical protein
VIQIAVRQWRVKLVTSLAFVTTKTVTLMPGPGVYNYSWLAP